MECKIGCSGWVFPFWRGLFYPNDLPQKEWFTYYSQHFDALEINSTFYHFPRTSSIIKWHHQAPQGFSYTIKANRTITHLKKFHDVENEVNSIYQLGDLLKEKLDMFLFQLPPSFYYSADNLDRIIHSLNPIYQNVVEFRHPSWWNTDVYELLAQHNIIFCSVSGLNLPNNIIETHGNIYIRLHPRAYEDCYVDEELLSWADHIRQINPKRAWVYFNNSIAAHAPHNAITLKKYLCL